MISFGVINGGVRNNIIPDEVELIGTIRNFDMGIRTQIHKKLKHTARSHCPECWRNSRGPDQAWLPRNYQ